MEIMTKKNDLTIFLEEQLIKVEEQIKKRNYSSDINEQILLWKLYELIRFFLEGIRK